MAIEGSSLIGCHLGDGRLSVYTMDPKMAILTNASMAILSAVTVVIHRFSLVLAIALLCALSGDLARAESASPSPRREGGQKTKTASKAQPSATPGSSASPAPRPRPRSSPQRAESKGSPTPKVEAKPRVSPSAAAEASPVSGSPSPSPKRSPESATTPLPVIVSSVSRAEIRDFEKNPPEIKNLLETALDLTTRKLGYVYGSADPSRGGMDCSGAIYYLLRQAGIDNPPRTASQQYVWARKSGLFQAVVGTDPNGFELDDLKPGDMLFWTGTYAIDREPPVTHTMFYLGRALPDGLPLMVGSSDGRTYRGVKQYGVSVFDFRIPKPVRGESGSRFVGYSRIPEALMPPPTPTPAPNQMSAMPSGSPQPSASVSP